VDGDRGSKSKAAIISDIGSGDRRLGSSCGGCCFDINANRAAAVEMKPPPLNDISTIVEAKRPQLPIPQWQDIDTAIGAWILRQFRKFGAKRREQLEQSAKRQACLAQSWRDEMIRTKPNMAHLLSGALFEKQPDWYGPYQALAQAERGLSGPKRPPWK
jgi:hypothetical protein